MSLSTTKPIVAILGATGGVGRCLLKQAVAGENRVRALVRSKAKLADIVGQESIYRLELLVEVDSTNPDDIGKLISGFSQEATSGVSDDIVLSCVGGSNHPVEPTAAAVVDALSTNRCPARFALLTSIGCGASAPQVTQISWVFGYVIKPFILAKVYDDLALGENVLLDSATSGKDERCKSKQYILFRPPGLDNKPALGSYSMLPCDADVSQMYWKRGAQMPREDVATAMLSLVETHEWDGRGVSVTVKID